MFKKLFRFFTLAALAGMLAFPFHAPGGAAQANASVQPALAVSAQGWIGLNGQQTASLPDLQVLASSPAEISLAAEIPGIQAGTTQLAGQSYTQLSAQGFGVGAEYGRPNLPVLRRYVEIPFGAQATLEVLRAPLVESSLAQLGLENRIAPLQAPNSKCSAGSEAINLDQETYDSQIFFPATPVSISGEFIQRGHRILVVEVWPVAYNPASGALRFYSQVDFKVNLTGSDMALTQANAERYATPQFSAQMARTVLNFNQGRSASLEATHTPVSYLIITADAYYDAMLPFVQLQEARGFQVTITKLSQIPATTKEQIKAYIQTAYDTWATPPSYVLLAGDTDTIPAWNSTQSSGKYTDLYYFTMDGASDWHPDLGRGRFPVRTAAQATAIVDKYLAYHGFTGDEPWLKKIAYIATCDNYTVAEGTHNYVINTYTQPKGYTGMFPSNPQAGGDKIYCVTNSGNADNIRNAANDGRWAIIYSGHGSETGWADGDVSFSQTDVRNLTDNGFFPFVASHACVTNSFNQTEAYGETWVLQAGKGALVFWGASHNSYWDEDDVLERRMFDSLFAEGDVHPDVWTMTDYGLTQVEADYPSSAQYYYEAYNIMGESSVKVFLEPEGPAISLEATPAQVGMCSTQNVTTTIQAEGLQASGQNLTLDLRGEPAGITGTFNPASFTLPNQSVLTLGDDGSTAAGTYPLSVFGQTTQFTQTTGITLNVYTTLPGQPALLTPADNTNNQPLHPTFTWAASQGGSFDVQIATDAQFTHIAFQATVDEPQYVPPGNLQPNTIYYWRVQAHNACGESIFSPVARFLSEPLAGQCAQGTTPTTLLAAGFDNSAPGWAHAGTGDTWGFSALRVHSGSASMMAADTVSVSDQQLTSPEIHLPSGQSPLTLEFWDYQRLENRSGGCYDGGIVEISTDGGQTWTQLDDELLTNPYNGPIASGSQNPLAGADAWCGKPRTWAKTLVDLDAFAGQDVQLRFRLGTNNAVGVEGWYVDDLAVNACAPTSGISPDSQADGQPGEASQHSFVLSNSGASDRFTLSLSGFTWPTEIVGTNVVTLTQGASVTVTVQVNVPLEAAGQSDEFTLTAASQNTPGLVLSAHGTTAAWYRVYLPFVQK